MARRTKIRSTVIGRKAKMVRGDAQDIELAQAVFIWKNELCLHLHQFNKQQLMNEEKISTRTWEGCTISEFQANPELYKRWNDKVIDYWHSTDDKCRITRIYDRFTRGERNGEWDTRICRSDRRHSVNRLKRKTNIGAGMITSAIKDNERLGLKQNVGQLFAKAAFEKIQAIPGLSEDKKLSLAAEAAFQQAIVAGEKTGRENVVNDILGVLDNRPAIKAIDDKSTDTYSNQAKERRKE